VSLIEKKQGLVEEVHQDIENSSAIYLINFEGITVETDNEFRQNLNQKGIRYRAVKNTLLKRALEKSNIQGLDNYLVGTTAIMLGDNEDPMLPAKELVQFYKKNPDLLPVKGVSMEGDVIEGNKISDLAKMPGRQEMIAQIVSIALSPGANLVAILKGPGSTIASQLKTLVEKLDDNKE
jgi:large subunit ribosomal protein L10